MESEIHGEILRDVRFALVRRYAGMPDVYVWGNLFLCYREGDPKACVVPDIFLVEGVGKKKDNPRRNYKLWEEGGRVPSLVIELTSEDTRAEDVEKKNLYDRLGVEELFLFYPYGDYLSPRLQGFQLEGGRYQPLPQRVDGSLESRTTGLILKPEGPRLRLRDKDTGEDLLTAAEADEARLAEAEARRAAEERASLAELRLRALEEEMKRLRDRPR